MSKFRRAGASLTLAYTIEHGVILVRNVIVARFLGPENFGIAATFLLVTSAVALLSDVGVERYLLHIRREEVSRFQSTLYTVMLFRGVTTAALVAILAGPVAQLFNIPELAHIYYFAALVPLMLGLRSLDQLARQRDLEYTPGITVILVSTILGAGVAIVHAFLTQSYMAIVWGGLVTAAVSLVMSHWLARDPWRLGLDYSAMRGLTIYGWPLMLNGMLIFIGSQGDRVIIGTLEGMTELAGYVAIGTLTVGASTVLMKLTGNLYLPILSAVRDDPAAFVRRNRLCGAITLAIIFATMVPALFLAAPAVALLFGAAYQVQALLAGWLAVQSAARILRAWPAVFALSRGNTRDILYANLIRSVGFPLALWAALSGYGVIGVAASMAVGEVVSTLFALLRADHVGGDARRSGLRIGIVFCMVFGMSLALQWLGIAEEGWIWPAVASIVITTLSLAGLISIAPDLRGRLMPGATSKPPMTTRGDDLK
jgi:O-antigen/teichoic acid export membrane protein